MRKTSILFIILCATIACKNNSSSQKNEVELTELNENSNPLEIEEAYSEPETYCTIKFGNQKIKVDSFEFGGTGNNEVGLTSSLDIEISEEFMEKLGLRIEFVALKKSMPPKLQEGSYSVEGSGDLVKMLENENTFHFSALDMETYNDLLKTYGKMDREDFLEFVYHDFVIIPDDKNALTIKSIEEIEGTREVLELGENMSHIKEELLVAGSFHLSLMKISTEEKFNLSCQFKGVYDYDWFNL